MKHQFWPSKDAVDQLAVRVRTLGLPIESYDQHVLTFIGNRIDKAIKVDKNTLYRENGKYDRLCIQVNLTKPLIARFDVKGRHFKVEYKVLYMLCHKCGKYGHIAEGCEVQYVKGDPEMAKTLLAQLEVMTLRLKMENNGIIKVSGQLFKKKSVGEKVNKITLRRLLVRREARICPRVEDPDFKLSFKRISMMHQKTLSLSVSRILGTMMNKQT